MTAHLEDCDSLLERAGELTNAAEEARRNLDARRDDMQSATGKLSLVEEQRVAAAQMITDAQDQLRDLEASELDEPTLRRELETARKDLAVAEESQAEATDALRAIEQAAVSRAATRDREPHPPLLDGQSEPQRLAADAPIRVRLGAECQRRRGPLT